MAGCTFARCPPIRHHTSAVDLPPLIVAELARYLFVRAGEGKSGSCVVIELACGPVRHVMTRGAVYWFGAPLELSRMDVLVAADAFLRRRLERNLPQARFGIHRPVTIHATQHAVRTVERERGHAVVEYFELVPRPQPVTGLADILPRLQTRFQDLRELPVVRVLMAPCAGHVGEMILPVGAVRGRFFAVTILARHRRMRSLQRE